LGHQKAAELQRKEAERAMEIQARQRQGALRIVLASLLAAWVRGGQRVLLHSWRAHRQEAALRRATGTAQSLAWRQVGAMLGELRRSGLRGPTGAWKQAVAAARAQSKHLELRSEQRRGALAIGALRVVLLAVSRERLARVLSSFRAAYTTQQTAMGRTSDRYQLALARVRTCLAQLLRDLCRRTVAGWRGGGRERGIQNATETGAALARTLQARQYAAGIRRLAVALRSLGKGPLGGAVHGWRSTS
jgi:hypothetical protein